MDNINLRQEYHNYSDAYTFSVLAQGKKKPPDPMAGGLLEETNLELHIKLNITPVHVIGCNSLGASCALKHSHGAGGGEI